MVTLDQIAHHLSGRIIGDSEWQVDSVATLVNAQSHQVSFLANSKYRRALTTTSAGAVLVSESDSHLVPTNAIVVDNSYIAYAKLVDLLYPETPLKPNIGHSSSIADSSVIGTSAVIAEHTVIEHDVKVGDNARIGSGTVIQSGVSIGKNARIGANVTICHDVEIGNNVIIHPGVVIGSDGFGLANDAGVWLKIPQIGSVIIGDNVEIGANTTIDRGAIEDTVVGNGVKLDNQIQLAHNVVIGDHTVIAGCSGIAGSTHVGKNCIIGGSVNISGHLNICGGVTITGNTMVTKSISSPGSYSSGMPAETTTQWHKNIVYYRQLSKWIQRIKKLER